ncbi:MAG: hypothetical protein NXI16_04490 [Alphaproteobacteria bacterium]|nr:hypothetical protein [Alphaproteobacteria bacterium]
MALQFLYDTVAGWHAGRELEALLQAVADRKRKNKLARLAADLRWLSEEDHEAYILLKWDWEVGCYRCISGPYEAFLTAGAQGVRPWVVKVIMIVYKPAWSSDQIDTELKRRMT